MSTEEILGNLLLHNESQGICRITLNRPEAANALLAEQRSAIIEILKNADQNPEVRVVVLASTGKQFCAGSDTGRIANKMNSSDEAQARRSGEATNLMLTGVLDLIEAILDCSKPVIAVVQGAAAGMGAHMAFACDLVVAAEESYFVESFILRGIVADAAGTYLLPRRIGLQKAKELCFLGDKFSAQQAADLGLVNQVVARENLEEAATALAVRLANSPTLAITLMKRLFNQSLDTDRRSAFVAESMAQEIATSSHDAKEGVTAFIEKRKPQFKGY